MPASAIVHSICMMEEQGMSSALLIIVQFEMHAYHYQVVAIDDFDLRKRFQNYCLGASSILVFFAHLLCACASFLPLSCFLSLSFEGQVSQQRKTSISSFLYLDTHAFDVLESTRAFRKYCQLSTYDYFVRE